MSEDIKIYDPDVSDGFENWFPSNAESIKLVKCLLACRDIAKLFKLFDSSNPENDYKTISMISTPLIVLLDSILELKNLTKNVDISDWPDEDKRSIVLCSKEINKLKNGKIRKVRHTRSAHYDENCFGKNAISKIELNELMNALCPAVCLLILMLNYEHIFTWTRSPKQDDLEITELYISGNPISTSIRFCKENSSRSIVGFHIISDPRHKALDIVLELINSINHISKKSKSKLPEITLKEMNIRT